MGKTTKIDWADATWSPVTGCLNDCEYCYARKIAERFGSTKPNEYFYPELADNPTIVLDQPVRKAEGDRLYDICPYPGKFKPTFHRYKLGVPAEWKEPKSIFVCSMGDLFGDWVPTEWIVEVFEACKKAPRHSYFFLTKNPQRYIELADEGLLPELPNFWYGTTTDRDSKPFFFCEDFNTFVSVEPILEDFQIEDVSPDCYVNWVIIGAETGRRKDRVIPQKEWIMKFADLCKKTGTPLFMKESLRELMGDDFVQELPFNKEGESE